MGDFPTDLLGGAIQRPWPLPDGPWIMTQTWHDLLFAHWTVDARELRRRVPAELPLDLFDGQAWIGVVPFSMTNVAPRGVPSVPFVSAFNELNVRTYVTLGGKPGVYFFSLDADSRMAVMTARTMFGLPYYLADMEVRTEGADVVYRSRRTGTPAEFRGRYRPVGSAHPPQPGSLEHFLTERYCLYTVGRTLGPARSRSVSRLEIHHPPWRLQTATAEIEVNTMIEAALQGCPAAPPGRPLLHFARRQDAVAWTPRRTAAGV